MQLGVESHSIDIVYRTHSGVLGLVIKEIVIIMNCAATPNGIYATNEAK